MAPTWVLARLRRSAAFLAVAGLARALEAKATIVDASYQEVIFKRAVAGITAMAWAPDDSNRLFFLLKSGLVRVIKDGALQTESYAAFPSTYTESESGLLGIAFDPGFIDNHYVYLIVTVSASEQQIIRLTDEGELGTNATVVVGGLPTRGANHNGGALGFGPDGKLYWAIGDNGNDTGVDTDLTTLASKVGRANPDGSVPNDNPFFDGPGPNNDYIWARGFRNPYTMTWSPRDEAMWLNVVGNLYEQVFVVKAGDHGGWNDFESNQPAPYCAPVLSYATSSTSPKNISATGAIRVDGTATFTTSIPHRYRPGAQITVNDVVDSSFNGVGFVTSVPSETQFTFSQPGPDATSGGGTASSQLIGNSILGGVFWDSTAVPANRRGFYFGDYGGGRLIRATLDTQGQVTAVEEWANTHKGYIDADIGPDGNLYFAGYSGNIWKVTHDTPDQGLVVSRLHLRIPEGGRGTFGVRLARAPSSTVGVSLARASGDGDVSIEVGTALAFDASNWSRPQTVQLIAAQDLDAVDDQALIAVSSAGLSTENVMVRVTDDDPLSLIVSATTLALEEGASTHFEISLSKAPPGPIAVAVEQSGDRDVTVTPADLSFDASNWSEPQDVTVTAAADDDTTDDATTLTVLGTGIAMEREVSVVVDDDDDSAPTIRSAPRLTAVVGAEYTYAIDADGRPIPSFSLDTAPSGMSVDAGAGIVTWVPELTTTEAVAIRAANGVAPDAVQMFEVVVVADQPPTCLLSAPVAGDVLSGTMSEFYGDVKDDVGAVGATFLVDGEAVYTDLGAAGHYHFGSAHNSFDTTHLADGPHLLGLVGKDTAGQTCTAEALVIVDNRDNGESEGPSGVGGTSGPVGAGGAAEPAGGAASDSSGGEPAIEQPEGGAPGLPGTSDGPRAEEGGGCSCRLARSSRPAVAARLWFALLALVAVRRRRQCSPRS